jgi:hypothetical protein
MECGGMVSSEANQCPHCKTNCYGIRGVNCTVCGEILKFSEARRMQNPFFDERSDSFHDSCYQQVSRKSVEKQTINCPVCTQPNQFSYNNRNQRINCSKCGHPYEGKVQNDTYSCCFYCGYILEKNLEVRIGKTSGYAHKLCYTPQRQSEQLQFEINKENRDKKMAEEARQEMKKKAQEKFESKLRGALLPGLFMGGLSVAMGVWAIVLFGILFGLYLIIDWE